MRLLSVVGAVLCGLVVAAPAVAGAQPGTEEFLVRPAPGSSTAAEGGYFLLEAEPGEVVTQQIELRNDSDAPIELEVKPVDAVTGPLGGASYDLGTDEVSRTGGWVTLDETSVVLAPDAAASVPFTVRVPADARNGEHLAGLAVAPVQPEEAAPQPDAEGAGASVDIQTRRVIAVQVNVPGPAEPELTVRGVRSAARPQGLYLEIDIDHVGTALTRGEGTVSVPGEDFEQDFTFDTFVPGTSIAYPVAWTTEPDEGEHQAMVELRYEDKVATWQGEVVVGEQVLEELVDRQVDPAAESEGGAGLPGWWPWALAAVAMLAVGVLAYRFGRRAPSDPERVRRT